MTGLARSMMLTLAASAAALGVCLADVTPASAENRTLSLYNTHTHERLTVTYKRDGRFVPEALAQLNRFLRDWRRDESTRMDPPLFDIIWDVYRTVGASEPIHVVSGYRSPATNEALRARSRGVARNSQHTLGHAMDYFIPGVPTRTLRIAGLRLQRGGVGYYPTANTPFVHMDTGSVRHWPRMTRQQLVEVFPNGGTVHVPSDQRPLPGYEQARAEVERNRRAAGIGGGPGAIQVASATRSSSGGGAVSNRDGDGVYAMLSGPSGGAASGGDDDGEGDGGGLLDLIFGGSSRPNPPAAVGAVAVAAATPVVAAAPSPAPVAAVPAPIAAPVVASAQPVVEAAGAPASITPPAPILRPVETVVASVNSPVPASQVLSVPAADAAPYGARAVSVMPPNPVLPQYETVLASAAPETTTLARATAILPPSPIARPQDLTVLASAQPASAPAPTVLASAMPASLAPQAIPAATAPASITPATAAFAPASEPVNGAQAAISNLANNGLRPGLDTAARRPVFAPETTNSVAMSTSPLVGKQSLRASAHARLSAPTDLPADQAVMPPSLVVASRFESLPLSGQRADRFTGAAIRWTSAQRFTATR